MHSVKQWHQSPSVSRVLARDDKYPFCRKQNSDTKMEQASKSFPASTGPDQGCAHSGTMHYTLSFLSCRPTIDPVDHNMWAVEHSKWASLGKCCQGFQCTEIQLFRQKPLHGASTSDISLSFKKKNFFCIDCLILTDKLLPFLKEAASLTR